MREFTASRATVWNDLPLHIASAPSLAVFRQRLQTFLFYRSYRDTILWLMCYYYHSSLNCLDILTLFAPRQNVNAAAANDDDDDWWKCQDWLLGAVVAKAILEEFDVRCSTAAALYTRNPYAVPYSSPVTTRCCRSSASSWAGVATLCVSPKYTIQPFSIHCIHTL